MKKLFFLLVMCIAALTVSGQIAIPAAATEEYVDLGLPSGIKWKNTNEAGYYDWDTADSKFGDKLPSSWQWYELKEECTWTWTRKGYKVTGKNGNSIFLPAASEYGYDKGVGSYGYYWSSTPWASRNEYKSYFYCYFSKREVEMNDRDRHNRYSVRLVQRPKQEYVDLDLPSWTLWKATNEEGGLHDWESAVNKFDNKLPTDWQWEELKKCCRWTWTGKGYRVTGKKGNSIFLPAAGYGNCDGTLSRENFWGYYWASSPASPGRAWYGCFNANDVNIGNNAICEKMSVRLVKKFTEVPQGYVDLDLPSGILWKTENEAGGYYDGDSASKFGENIPSYAQWIELLTKCYGWTWTGKGYKITGKNGNSIFLPATGYRDVDGSIDGVDSICTYWISSAEKWRQRALPIILESIDTISFGLPYDIIPEFGLPIRLVQAYVDLGLPSGTKWKVTNESEYSAYGLYGWERAKELFGDKLPTKEQWEELSENCSWTWTDKGYKVRSRINGNFIFLPATGYRDCEGNLKFADIYHGYYWSTNLYPYNPEKSAWVWNFNPDYRGGWNALPICSGLSIRLVQGK